MKTLTQAQARRRDRVRQAKRDRKAETGRRGVRQEAPLPSGDHDLLNALCFWLFTGADFRKRVLESPVAADRYLARTLPLETVMQAEAQLQQARQTRQADLDRLIASASFAHPDSRARLAAAWGSAG